MASQTQLQRRHLSHTMMLRVMLIVSASTSAAAAGTADSDVSSAKSNDGIYSLVK